MSEGFKFCLLTNECTTAKRLLSDKLNKMGYDCIDPSKIVSPAPAACQYLLDNNLKPRLHVWDGVLEDFEPIRNKYLNDKGPETCLVVGDVMTKVSRDYVDESLEIMLDCPQKPVIITLGTGRYYRDAGRIRMDTGGYAAAFEHCLGVKAINVGKPSSVIFESAMKNVAGTVDDTIMIGDDVLSDVGGAQQHGMRGFLVRTGKYKPRDESADCPVKPNYVFNDLKEAIETISKFCGTSGRLY